MVTVNRVNRSFQVNGIAGFLERGFICIKVGGGVRVADFTSYFLEAGVRYIRQNNLQFYHFLPCTQALNIYRSLSLI